VGDDVTVFDEELFKTMSSSYEAIGCELTLPKCKIPSESGPSIAEFCSRTGAEGVDVSRIPPGLIRNASNN
jgi:hypothetical protein